MNFKVGQTVVAKERFDTLVEGRTYEIDRITQLEDEQLLFLKDEQGGFLSFRFRFPKAPPPLGCLPNPVNIFYGIPESLQIKDESSYTLLDGTQPETCLYKGMTLPTDSKSRKDYPLLSGCINYFPAALAGVSLISKKGNDKHNPGEEMHHARQKSKDHGDCILRHLIDVQDLLASDRRSALTPLGIEQLKEEVSCLAWRALAYSQELHEKFGAPLAPGARL